MKNVFQQKNLFLHFLPMNGAAYNQEVAYKFNEKSRPLQSKRTYFRLPKNTWTPILAEHFWVHTLLPCCLSFRRAKVYPTGSSYIVVIGRCTICNSQFKGIVTERPPESSRYISISILHFWYLCNKHFKNISFYNITIISLFAEFLCIAHILGNLVKVTSLLKSDGWLDQQR